MSGHSKWSQIKRKKAVTDQKRAKVFTKLLAAVSIAAKTEPNPDFNPRLRATIEKAREASVPQENIERAIKKAKENPTDELVIESYGPDGTSFIIKAVTDNRNRTIAEVKKILLDNNAKFAEQGSVLWGFNIDDEGNYESQFPKSISPESQEKILTLMEALDENNDVTDIFTNAEIDIEE